MVVTYEHGCCNATNLETERINFCDGAYCAGVPLAKVAVWSYSRPESTPPKAKARNKVVLRLFFFPAPPSPSGLLKAGC